MVKEISSLTDAELRNELIALSGAGGDAKIGPVTGTTRSLFEKKLAKLRKGSGVTAKGKAPGAQSTTSVRPSAKKAVVKKVPASEEESDFEDEDEPMDISVVSKSHMLTSTPDYNATPPPIIPTHTPSSTKRSRGRPPSTRRLSPPSHNLSDVLSASGDSLHDSPKRSVDISPFADRPEQTSPRKRAKQQIVSTSAAVDLDESIEKFDDLPYSAEYANSNRTTCKGCRQKIGEGHLRMSANEPSRFFDGVQSNWFHFSCFWKKLKKGDKINEASIRGMDWLKWDDQVSIREAIARLEADSKDARKSTAEEGMSFANFKAEHSRSNRGKCSSCKDNFKKSQVKLMQKGAFFHPLCIIPIDAKIEDSVSQVQNFDKLTDEGRYELRACWPQIKVEKQEQDEEEFTKKAVKKEDPETSFNEKKLKSTYGGGHRFTNWKSSARGTSALLDLGNTTGEEDESDGGQETSRIVYSSSGNRQRDRQDTGRGKIKAKVATLWDSFLGNKFDAGKEPGRHYEMRHGATRTRVDRDPKTNKIKVKHDTIGQDWPQLLLNIFIVFAVLLAVLYAISAHPNEVNRLGKTVTSCLRDSVRFLYQYVILPVIIVFGAALTVLVCYYGQKRYVHMKEEEERAFYELVDQITRMVHESFTDEEPYISQPHVRDLIFPPAKRRGAELARWERAAQFIDESESRIATESRMMPSGHECAVWRWIGGKRKI